MATSNPAPWFVRTLPKNMPFVGSWKWPAPLQRRSGLGIPRRCEILDRNSSRGERSYRRIQNRCYFSFAYRRPHCDFSCLHLQDCCTLIWNSWHCKAECLVREQRGHLMAGLSLRRWPRVDNIALLPAAIFSHSSRSCSFITVRSIHSRVGQSDELSRVRTSASYCGVNPLRMTMSTSFGSTGRSIRFSSFTI